MDTATSAKFMQRDRCIACASQRLAEVATGGYDDEPLRSFIANDPWGEQPGPYLRGQAWHYVECKECGTRFHRNVLSPEWNDRRFEHWMSHEAIKAFELAHAPTSNDHEMQRGSRNSAHVLRIAELTRPLRKVGEKVRVLDFGSGYGEFLSVCSAFGMQAFGVDRASARRDHSAVRVFAEIDEAVEFAPFHALTLFEVLEHLDEPAAILRRLSDLLVPGGVLVLETPDASGVQGIETMHDYRMIHPLDHINGFTPDTLRSIGVRMGFEPITPPAVSVTVGTKRAAKSLVKGMIASRMKQTTQIYFIKK